MAGMVLIVAANIFPGVQSQLANVGTICILFHFGRIQVRDCAVYIAVILHLMFCVRGASYFNVSFKCLLYVVYTRYTRFFSAAGFGIANYIEVDRESRGGIPGVAVRIPSENDVLAFRFISR